MLDKTIEKQLPLGGETSLSTNNSRDGKPVEVRVEEGIETRVMGDAYPKDWYPNDPGILIPLQPATKIYLNGYNSIVICQEAADSADEDPFVQLRPEHIALVIEKLRALAKKLGY